MDASILVIRAYRGGRGLRSEHGDRDQQTDPRHHGRRTASEARSRGRVGRPAMGRQPRQVEAAATRQGAGRLHQAHPERRVREPTGERGLHVDHTRRFVCSLA